MDNLKTEHLFEKLINWKLPAEELAKLTDYFREQTSSGEIDKYFLRIWDECRRYNTDLHSEDLFNKIQQRLNINHDKTKVKKVSLRFINLLKYAAVFFVAFAVSWLLNIQLNNKHIAQQTSDTGNHEIAVSLGSKSKITLPDGSVINLNSGSRLTYPAHFADRNRQVHLEGEAYFEVNADSSKPFYVHTSDITVKVIGTSFNVKSYPESNTIETTLISGSLEISDKKIISNDILKLGKNLRLKPNQKAVYIKDLDKLTLEDRKELKLETGRVKGPDLSIQDLADTHSLTGWKDNKLIFNNERFEDLAIKLERWYNVKITIKARELKKERFTGTFENETTEQVLNALKMAEPFEYTINKNEIIIFDSKIIP